MARKLIFKVNSKTNQGLCFSSHYGSQIQIAFGGIEVLPLRENDEQPEAEILEFYNSRYTVFGLSTKCFDDSKQVVTPAVVAPVITPVTDTVVTPPKVTEEAPGQEKKHADLTDAQIEEMDFKVLKSIVEELKLKVEGRGKEAYQLALKAYVKGE